MKKAAPLSPAVQGLKHGDMALEAEGEHLECYLSMPAFLIAKLPRVAPVETRLASWQIHQMLVPAFLVRINKNNQLIFETWIDAGAPDGICALKALAHQKSLQLHLVDQNIERKIRAQNEHLAEAAGIVKRLQTWRDWGGMQLALAKRELHRMYPARRDLWFAAARRADITATAP